MSHGEKQLLWQRIRKANSKQFMGMLHDPMLVEKIERLLRERQCGIGVI